MSKKKPPSIYTALRIPPELRKQAEEQAAKEGRTLSNYIKHLIRRDTARVAEKVGSYKARRKK
jgi:predicted DNA-binding protein